MSIVDERIVSAANQAFPSQAQTLTLGAGIYGQACDPEPAINMPLNMMNRHGLIATGTVKTNASGDDRTALSSPSACIPCGRQSRSIRFSSSRRT